MKRAFRYAPRKYSDSLLALGNVRIGTLHDFRRSEHKRGIADANEGKKVVVHHTPFVTTEDEGSIHLRAFKEFGAIDIGDSHGCTFKDITVQKTFDMPDCFVHCISSKLSVDVMREFEGADSCLEITRPIEFYERLTRTLSSIVPVSLYCISDVKYRTREELWNGNDWGHHPALIKESEFSDQYEVRAIWIPRFNGVIAPVVVNDVELIKYLEPREVN